MQIHIYLLVKYVITAEFRFASVGRRFVFFFFDIPDYSGFLNK